MTNELETLNAICPGWKESPTKRLLCNRNAGGGIIDAEIVSEKWFVIFNDNRATLSGFESRSAAIKAFIDASSIAATITESSLTNTGLYVQATCGKVSALVCILDHGVRVTCQNEAHKVWKGAGRFFATIQEALDGYKKPEMKAIIAAADAMNR